MKHTLFILALMMAIVAFSGCSRFALDTRDLGEPISMTRNVGFDATQNANAVFETSTRVGYCGWLFNLVTLKNADLSALVNREIKARDGDGVRNLTIKKEMSFLDGVISIVSFGFYVPETITIKGEVVQKP